MCACAITNILLQLAVVHESYYEQIKMGKNILPRVEAVTGLQSWQHV